MKLKLCLEDKVQEVELLPEELTFLQNLLYDTGINSYRYDPQEREVADTIRIALENLEDEYENSCAHKDLGESRSAQNVERINAAFVKMWEGMEGPD